MARIRTIKPDAFTSDSLSSVPRGTRWTFAGLWTYADDAGRARDDARLVKAALYPIDDDTTLSDVANDLDALHSIGAICRYEVGGKRYLHMPKWGHQKINRPTPAKSPPCPLHEDGSEGEVVVSDPYVSPHPQLTEDSVSPQRGKGREGKGIGKDSCASVQGASNRDASDAAAPDGAGQTEGFAEFWDVYGKKVDRKKAEQKWRLALKKPGVTADMLIEAARRYVTWQRANNEGGKYVMDPSKWLNNERWNDEASDIDAAAPEATRPVALRQCETTHPHDRHRWEDAHNHYFCQGEQ